MTLPARCCALAYLPPPAAARCCCYWSTGQTDTVPLHIRSPLKADNVKFVKFNVTTTKMLNSSQNRVIMTTGLSNCDDGFDNAVVVGCSSTLSLRVTLERAVCSQKQQQHVDKYIRTPSPHATVPTSHEWNKTIVDIRPRPGHVLPPYVLSQSKYRERQCAENYNKWHYKFIS